MTTADKLITIAENVPKVYHAGQLNVIENTSTLKKNVSGSAILIDDVSPVTHDMGVKVRGKNLIPYPYRDTTKTVNGVTFTDNGDGTITVNTEENGATGDTLFFFTLKANIKIQRNTQYTASGVTGGSYTTYFLRVSTSDRALTDVSDAATTFQINSTESDVITGILLSVKSGTVMDNVTIYPQMALGTTATAYTPYVSDLTAVKVSRCGKNLLSAMSLHPTVTNNAVPIHFKVGQKYTISFATTYTAWRLMFFGTDKNGTAFDASSPNANKYISGTYTGTTGRLQFASNQSGNTFTFTCNEDCIITAIVFWNVANETDKIYSDFQLELGSTATDYEPYKECEEYTPTADGTVNGVTSLYPNTTLMTDTNGVIIDCEYYKDIDANDVIERTVTTYTNPKVKIIGSYAFYDCSSLTTADFPVATSVGNYAFHSCSKLTTVDLPNATSVGSSAFQSCSSLTTVDLPNATSVENSAFYGCKSLITADLPNVTSVESNVFQNCSSLTTVDLPNATSVDYYAFQNCSSLTIVDFPNVTSVGSSAFYGCKSLITADFPIATSISSYAFEGCSKLTELILRNSTMCTLSNKNAFTGCTLINGTGGYIYVPSSLVDAYKTATNWVTYASKFRALEDYTVDGTTTGALDESKVKA